MRSGDGQTDYSDFFRQMDTDKRGSDSMNHLTRIPKF